jgi:hypothetical protein
MTQKSKVEKTEKLLPEDQLWAGLEFPVLSYEELARQQANVEDRVHHNRGVWWRQARPFFWQPCFCYQPLNAGRVWPAHSKALGGFTHIAEAGAETNGFFRSIVRDNIQKYSVQWVPRERRNKIRNGLANLTIRPVKPAELLEQGYDVYVSWRNRVQWGRNKGTQEKYALWIGKVVRQPKRLRLGAFHQGRLVAFMLPFACDEFVVLSYIASHSDSLHLHPNDLLYHALLTIARQTAGIRMAEFGAVSSKGSLDKFKLGYGSVREFPSYTWINPIVRPFVMPMIRRKYPWLQGAQETSAPNPEAKAPEKPSQSVDVALLDADSRQAWQKELPR